MTAGAAVGTAPTGVDDVDPSPSAHRVRRWLAADPRRRVALAAAVVIAGQAGLRSWVAYRGYFFLDDFAFTGRAAQYSLTDLHGFLMQPYNSHLMPGAFAEVWVLTKLWPLNFGVVVTVNLVLQILVDVAFYRLLRELFGTRPAILVPFTAFVFTPITLSAFVWWAAALNQLPQQLAMLTALWCQTRYLRTGRVRVGIYGAPITLVGLLFSEKTLLTVPLVMAFTVLFFADGNVVRRIITVSRAHWRVWLAYLVVAIPYTAYYVLEVPSPGHAPHGGDIAALFGSAFSHAIDPGLIGGPWSWHPAGFVGALADPSKLTTYVAGISVIGFVAWTIAWRRRAVFGWLMGIGYASIALLLLAFSRAVSIGPIIGDEFRYVTDVAAVGILGGTLAVLRPAGKWQTTPELIEHRAWTRRFVEHHLWHEVRAAVPPPRPVVGIVAFMAVFIASATASTLRFDRYWSSNPARPYLTTLRTELAAAPKGMVLYDQEVPPQVAWALLFPYNRLSYLLKPLSDNLQFLEPGRSAPSLAMSDDQGNLRRVAIFGPHAVPGPQQNGCSWLLGPVAIRMRLDGTTFPWTWMLRMAYIASKDTSGTVHAGRTVATVTFRRGLHELYVQVVGAISTVTFSSLAHGATVCTSDLAVGKPVPIGGSTP
ncbi:MAG TPA: hypothetical protein VGH43_02675 [Jatrophihabitans sp.]